MWQKDDDGIKRNFDDAAAYCHSLTLAGHHDWRLPTLAEFGSLVEAAKESGLKVNTFYSRSSGDDYWTGTPGPQGNVAYIADGTTMFRTNTYCVRAVRRT
jgi:formylglycine-generating enzyme required for sulfatase activity